LWRRNFGPQGGKLNGKVVRVVHAFPEDDEVSRDMHLRYWYGTVHPEDDVEDDNPVVCWCGARHVEMKEGVVAVWHIQSWNDRGW
jgi:hypothetical protein